MTTSDERRAAGREIQGQLWPATLKGPTGQFPAAKLAPEYFDHVLQSAFGDVWSRPGLPVRDRSMITVALLAALGQPEELRSHLAGALNVGITARRSSRSSCTSRSTPASPPRARRCAWPPTCSAPTEAPIPSPKDLPGAGSRPGSSLWRVYVSFQKGGCLTKDISISFVNWG